MARLHHVKASRKAVPSANISVGDSYYWWQFAYGPKRYSKEKPRRSSLTRSEYKAQVWDLIDNTSAPEYDSGFSLEDFISELVNQVEDIRDGCQERLDAIPDQLKDGTAGQTLQDRIDAAENVISNLEGLDIPEEPTSEMDGLDLDDTQAVAKAMEALGIDSKTPDGWDKLVEAMDEARQAWDDYRAEWESLAQEAVDALGDLDL